MKRLSVLLMLVISSNLFAQSAELKEDWNQSLVDFGIKQCTSFMMSRISKKWFERLRQEGSKAPPQFPREKFLAEIELYCNCEMNHVSRTWTLEEYVGMKKSGSKEIQKSVKEDGKC